MKVSTAMILTGALVGLSCGPAAAHRPYFAQSEAMSATEHPSVMLKLLSGDGILFADPVRAVVVDRDGTLLAASPSSTSLRIHCDRQRHCLAYDDLTRTVYTPVEDQWRSEGTVEQDGVPQRYPEDIVAAFGFAEREATLGEAIRFEAQDMLASWLSTAIAVAWWALFWLLLLPLARFALGPDRRLTIGRIGGLMGRTVGALLMIPLATYAWLLAPYSMIYLAFVLICGAMVALLLAKARKTAAS